MNASVRSQGGLLQRVLMIITVAALCAVWANAYPQSDQEPRFTGKELVDIHCVRCHMAPVPDDLSRELWPKVLVAMGLYLGVEGEVLPDIMSVEPKEAYAPYSVQKIVTDAQGNEHDINAFKAFVVSEPLVSEADWLLIRDYFVENAPLMADMVLPAPEHPVLEGFIPTVPALDLDPNGLVITTLVDEERQRLYVGSASGRMVGGRGDEVDRLLAFDLRTGRQVGEAELPTEPIDLELTESGVRLSVHGEFPVQPGNPEGYISDWTGFDTRESRSRMVVNGLHRITQHQTHDLNGDGLEDIVATMFGDGNLDVGGGRFSIFWQTPDFAEVWEDAPAEIPLGPLDGGLRETVLMERAGVMSAGIADFTGDGRPDIALLTAQGAQEVILFVNLGNELFAQRVVSEYSPAFGGNSLYAEDMDGDGQTDIVLINGDFSTGGTEGGITQPKAYHGLRILRNNGDLTFTESYFYPMHGALKSAIADYDGDGDRDIALIAQYPRWDWEEPHTFVYLQNQGEFAFEPALLPRDYWGLWISVEAADVNADAKPDIVLGLANWPAFVPEDWTTREILEGRDGAVPTITFLLNDH